jgi:DnaJ-class molecular chaperone
MSTCTDCEGARYDNCVPCRGSGSDIRDCHACHGRGGFEVDVHGQDHWEPCGACDGEGRYNGPCDTCDGTGSIESHCSKCGGKGYLPQDSPEEDDGSMMIDVDEDSDSDSS